jgi:hypothetical protein
MVESVILAARRPGLVSFCFKGQGSLKTEPVELQRLNHPAPLLSKFGQNKGCIRQQAFLELEKR